MNEAGGGDELSPLIAARYELDPDQLVSARRNEVRALRSAKPLVE